MGKDEDHNRTKLLKICEESDFDKSGKVMFLALRRAFSQGLGRMDPVPTKEEMIKLFKALDAYDEDTDDFDYRKFLRAPVTRETVSVNGKFPKIVSYFMLIPRNRKPSDSGKRPKKRRRKMRPGRPKKRPRRRPKRSRKRGTERRRSLSGTQTPPRRKTRRSLRGRSRKDSRRSGNSWKKK